MGKKDDDRAAADKRAENIRRQVLLEGKKIKQVMAEQRAKNSRSLLAKALNQDKRGR